MASGAASVTGLQIPHQQQPPRDDLHHRSPWYVVSVFVIPVLENVVQLHFDDSSPFDEHPTNLWRFLFSLLSYCTALGFYVKSRIAGFGSFRNICDQVGYVSESLACAALILVVVPPSLELSIFAIWMVASTMFVDASRCWILKVAQKPYHLA